MKQFLLNTFFFLAGFAMLIAIGILLPVSKVSRESYLFSKVDKDSLIKYAPSPRLVLVGGSNLSFSLDSQLLKDSLHLNPVNTGISGAIGLHYMLDNSLPNIKPGDVIIVCPEYSQFYGDATYGEDYLIKIIMDISPSELLTLRGKQLTTQLGFLPRYAFTKFKVTQYLENNEEDPQQEVYKRVAFNQYGDVSKHWSLEKGNVEPYPKMYNFNEEVVDKLCEYKALVEDKGAKLFITFPAFQTQSYNNQVEEIKLIEQSLRERKFSILGTPERYRVSDDLIYDTPYHLIKQGVEIRTHLLIEDLKKENIYGLSTTGRMASKQE